MDFKKKLIDLPIDTILLLIENIGYMDHKKLCNTSTRLREICKENQNYIDKNFLRKLYPDQMIELLNEINKNENINLHKLTDIVHKFFNKKTFEEILYDGSFYISKSYDVFVRYNDYILPLPYEYYNEKMDIRLYINNEYEKFNNDITYIAKQLWTNSNFKKTQNFDLIEVNRREVKYINLNDEINMLIDILDNFSKSSNYYKDMVSRINNLKRFKVLYNNLFFNLSETYEEFKGAPENLPEKQESHIRKSKSTKKKKK